MDLEQIVRAAPIGLFMLVGSYLAARRRKSGHLRAVEEFPAVAARLGVAFRAPSLAGGIGTLRGEVDGYGVFVDPDERPRIVVYFTRNPPLVLRTYEHEKRVPSGMTRRDLGNTFLNGFFKERYASEGSAEALAPHMAALEAGFRRLSEQLDRNLSHVSVTGERVECAFEFGRPAHIPAALVETLVRELVALSRLLETAHS